LGFPGSTSPSEISLSDQCPLAPRFERGFGLIAVSFRLETASEIFRDASPGPDSPQIPGGSLPAFCRGSDDLALRPGAWIKELHMTKQHLLYWIFDFLAREHPAVLRDMQERITGDAGDRWVKAGFAERLAAYQEVSAAGYKFLGEFRRDGQPSVWRDVVVAHPDRNLAQAEANAHLHGADKVEMIILSSTDLDTLKLQKGQIRTNDGIGWIKGTQR
jgi:hypothetical protein